MPMFVVCPACEGTGRDASTAYAITSDELDEAVGSDYGDRMDYVRAVADLTQGCPTCRARRVVTPEVADKWENEWEIRAEMEQEARWGY